jgi:hypothetical protein
MATPKQTLARSIELTQKVVDKYRRYVGDARDRNDPNDQMIYEARLLAAEEIHALLLQQEHERYYRLPRDSDRYDEMMHEVADKPDWTQR